MTELNYFPSENSNLSDSASEGGLVKSLRNSWRLYKAAKALKNETALRELQVKIHSLQDKLHLPKTNFIEANNIIEPERDSGGWTKGSCSKCGTQGVHWDGGKKSEHFCIKCNPMIVMEKKKKC